MISPRIPWGLRTGRGGGGSTAAAVDAVCAGPGAAVLVLAGLEVRLLARVLGPGAGGGGGLAVEVAGATGGGDTIGTVAAMLDLGGVADTRGAV